MLFPAFHYLAPYSFQGEKLSACSPSVTPVTPLLPLLPHCYPCYPIVTPLLPHCYPIVTLTLTPPSKKAPLLPASTFVHALTGSTESSFHLSAPLTAVRSKFIKLKAELKSSIPSQITAFLALGKIDEQEFEQNHPWRQHYGN